MDLRAGDRIDHYTLVKPLGEGGQGSVWQVIDPREGGVARALKLVRIEEAGRAGFERARREAKILAAAKHPALVTCHSFFEDLHAGLVGLVMDLVPGSSLADAAAGGRLDRGRAFAALEQIAEALAYVHGAGLVHRDLKPDNVLLADDFWRSPTRPGLVKLVDFGIAAPAGNPRPLTALGAVVGTIPYMAPELIDPATWGKAEGPARDLFAFGVLAWEILFGRHPTGLGPQASMIDHARAYKAAEAGRIPWPPPGIEGAWGAALGACLALRPADRPANGAELLRILRSESVPSVRAPVSEATSSAVTTPHRAPALSRTEPAIPPPPRTLKTPPAAKTERSLLAKIARVLVVVLVLVASMIVIGFGVVVYSVFGFGRSAPAPDQPLPASPPRSPMPAPAPAPAPVAALITSPAACCPTETSTCTGPTRFACPACAGRREQLPRHARWWARIEGARYGTSDLTNTNPNATLTMRAGIERRDLPFALIPAHRAGAASLPVTTEDIEGGLIRFTLTEGTATLADGFGFVDANKGHDVLVSALCAGLLLHVTTSTGTPVTLSVFLDPRDP